MTARVGIGGRLEIERLNSITSAAFNNFTYRAYQHILYGLESGGRVAAFGALVDGVPAGMSICEFTPASSNIVSICVGAEFRNQGVGAALLTAAEEELTARGSEQAVLTYATGKPTTPALERMLAKCGWPEPQPKHLICTSDKRMYTSPWMSEYKLPASFEVFPWSGVTAEDRASLERSQAAENWIPKGLWPFDYEGTMEPANSLGVRYRGEVVGWVVTQPREPDAVCYSCSWMRPDLQRRGRLIAAYAEAVRRQIEFTNKPIGIWIVPYHHESMAAFVLRRMKPWLITLAEFRHSKKQLHELARETAA